MPGSVVSTVLFHIISNGQCGSFPPPANPPHALILLLLHHRAFHVSLFVLISSFCSLRTFIIECQLCIRSSFPSNYQAPAAPASCEAYSPRPDIRRGPCALRNPAHWTTGVPDIRPEHDITLRASFSPSSLSLSVLLPDYSDVFVETHLFLFEESCRCTPTAVILTPLVWLAAGSWVTGERFEVARLNPEVSSHLHPLRLVHFIPPILISTTGYIKKHYRLLSICFHVVLC
jgi:hypothetical protein